MAGQAPPPTGYYVQDPKTGYWFPIEREAEFPNGNISVNGESTSHYFGMQAYQQQQAGANQPAAPQEPPGIHQVATAPDGVPYFQSSDGKYWTKNGDGSYTQQTIDPASWNTKPPGDTSGGGGGGGAGAGGGGGNGGLINPYPGQLPQGPFQAPGPADLPSMGLGGGPAFTPPAYKPPPAFEAPTWDQAREDPGFKFVQQEGQTALENSAAAKGLLYSGGTLKDISTWNQGLADTQYQNVFNRNLNQYMTNYQTQFTDPYANAYKGALDQFNPQQQQWMTNMQAQQHANDFNYQNAWDQYKYGYQQWLDRIHESEKINDM